MSGGEPVLLLGPKAAPLAPRLELSGYRCQALADPAGLEPALGDKPIATGEPIEPPALVVVGLAPPDGPDEPLPELLARLRQLWPGVPLLLDIGVDSVEGRSHCLSSGANDFWLSSLGASDLLARVRLHLQLRSAAAIAQATIAAAAKPPAPAAPPGALLRCGELRLDPATRQVWRGSRELELTGREYALLELLIRHCGAVVSREEILAAVWSDQASATSNVIEVYVRYLRQKLEVGGGRRLIHTLRGRGYSLGERPPPRP